MKILYIIVLMQFPLIALQAQTEMEPPVGAVDMPSIKTNISRIYGKILDSRTGKGLTAASVQLLVLPADSSQPMEKDSILRGMLTKDNGDFSFENIQVAGRIQVRISAIGYETTEQTINLQRGGGNGVIEKDLGNISLGPEVKKMDDVVIVSKATGLTMGIDRKIFTADKILTSAGGTAVDIMKNIPSVSVDIEGNVELRNSTPQIFIDGTPTILTLDQIPADHVDRIELITNPSAKFDASSSGGIINIILKKNKRIGMNGLATISGGTPALFSTNLNLNLRQGKFNFFLSGGYNQSGGRAKGQTLRENKENGSITDYFNQYTLNERSRKFSSIRFGVDYAMDNRNTITVSQNFVKGQFNNNEVQDQEYLNNNKILEYYGERDSDGKFGFDRSSTKLNYKHSFPKTGQELVADFNYNYGTRSGSNNIINTYFFPDGTAYQETALVRNEGDNKETQFTFQLDYTNPVTELTKIETGIRSFRNEFNNTYAAFADNNGTEVKLPLSNNYEYTETVHAAYATFSGKTKSEKFSYQLGLRTEYSKFEGELVDSAFKFGYEYPADIGKIWNALFPSFFLSKKINEDNELQFNYSRRIRRPRFWQLNPFIDINDPVNLRQGNPQLRPEFINSFEFNYNRKYKTGNFLGVLYFRNNPDDITEYSDTITAAQYQQLNNAAVDPNAIVNTFINASTTNRYGAEFTLQHNFSKNFDIMPTIDLQYRTVNANVKELNLNNKGFNWEAKLILNYKTETTKSSFFNNFGFQLTGEYESPQVIPQGREIAQFNVDAALRKDFLKNKKATITFAVNDIFNSRRWGTIYDTERFYQDSYRRWNVRNFRLSLSYKFGDANFSFGKRGGNQGGNEE